MPSASPSLSADFPVTTEEVDGWLAEREATIARAIRVRLRDIVVGAYESFLSTLTASGDLGAFDPMPAEWRRFIETDLGDAIGGVYLAGSGSAWVRSKAPVRMSRDVAEGWTDVVNQEAVEYQRTATNRLVGVGDDIWRDVRDQTVEAIEEGYSNEALKDRVQAVGDMTEYRADTIARTETVAAYNAGQYEGAQQLGEFGPVEKAWMAASDRRVRPTHREADGQTVAFADDFRVGDVRMAHPLAEGAPPEEVVNCRCVLMLLYPGDTRPDGTVIDDDVGRSPEMRLPDESLPYRQLAEPLTPSKRILTYDDDGVWGNSYTGSSMITGEAAHLMGIPGYARGGLASEGFGANTVRDIAERVVDDGLPEKLLTQITRTKPSARPLYSGIRRGQERFTALEPGQRIDLPPTSTTPDASFAHESAADPRRDDRADPVILRVEPGAQATKYANNVDEYLTAGEYEVVEVHMVSSLHETWRLEPAPDVKEIVLRHVATFDPNGRTWRAVPE